MRQQPNGLSPSGDFEERLHRAFRTLPVDQQQTLPAYDLISYTPLIDSSAATPLHWQQLAQDIADQMAHYRGFVIIHGTDTLSWTASSLAYQLQGIDRPVVLTGAMHPLEAPNSDALNNVYGALRFAAQPALQEVAIYFANHLLRGVRAIKQHCEAVDAFSTPNYPLIGERVSNDFIHYPSRSLAHQQRGAPRFELATYQSLNQGEVVRISLWPGISPWQLETLLADERVKGALIQLWGAGNIPNDPALLHVLATAYGEGKLIAGISQCPQGSIHLNAYAASDGLADAGVLPGGNMTPEAAYTKLVHLIAQPISLEDKRHQFLASLVGER